MSAVWRVGANSVWVAQQVWGMKASELQTTPVALIRGKQPPKKDTGAAGVGHQCQRR